MFNTLPNGGGLLDQPAFIIEGMKLVMIAEKAKAEQEAEKASKKKK